MKPVFEQPAAGNCRSVDMYVTIKGRAASRAAAGGRGARGARVVQSFTSFFVCKRKDWLCLFFATDCWLDMPLVS